MSRKNLTSPMMRQWQSMKEEVGDDTILFCRVGDFYELFFEDAVIGARELDIALTSRKIQNTSHPLAGVPVRSVDIYVGKLVNKGYKVAIADQLEDPKAVKGVVDRGITRIVTRGTLTEDSLLPDSANNYIVAIVREKKGRKVRYGVAMADLSCGEFYARTFDTEESLKEYQFIIESRRPVELIFPESETNSVEQLYMRKIEDETLSPVPNFWFDPQESTQMLHEHFEVKSLKGYGVDDYSLGASAAGALLRYLNDTQKRKVNNITRLQFLESRDSMMLDRTVIKSLEIFENSIDGGEEGTVVKLLDRTVTPMGARELRKWLSSPLVNREAIQRRHDIIEMFIEDELLSNHLRGEMEAISDIERLVTRISLGIARPNEIVRLRTSLESLPDIREILVDMDNHSPGKLGRLVEDFDDCKDIVAFISKMILDNPAASIADGDVIASGVNSRLDELREVLREGERWVEKYIEKEKARTGITSLKVKQNRHIGYYIEVTKSNLSKVPDNYRTRQSMVNVVRFTTDELKQWEYDIINAEVEIKILEQSLYDQFLKDLTMQTNRVQGIAKIIAEIDVLLSFAYVSLGNDYSKPTISDSHVLTLRELRHPVIETFMEQGAYTPNDVFFDTENCRLLIITGPNFSGKSSLLRAVALNVIFAQIGCFIPASEGTIGIVDRIFTRIGASDNLIAGQSTFMVEMLEAANLVNNATARSLIIADELGRGTSTYDGLAIAWSISEYLHDHPLRPFVLIATHFHQLADLEGFLETARNFHFNIEFDGENPIFDHRMFPGPSDKSFGVEVAKLAGLPREIILRARFILEVLESQAASLKDEDIAADDIGTQVKYKEEEREIIATIDEWFGDGSFDPTITPEKLVKKKKADPKKKKKGRPSLSPQQAEVLSTIRSLSINSLTPIKALEILEELKSLLDS